MPLNQRVRPKRQFSLGAEALEHRSLLIAIASGVQEIVIQVPSEYVSQQSSQLDVTLSRTTPSGQSDSKGSVTVDFTASYGEGVSGQEFTPVHQSVTFPAGQATETVAVPINPGAENPGLVPVQLTVTSSSRLVKGTSTTVYLASGATAIPPSITGVQRVAGGIAITFSKPMNHKTVENVHNYVVKYQPKKSFNIVDLYGPSLIPLSSNSPVKIPLRRATYDPATNTVLLVATEQLGSKGSYQISNPASLVATRGGPLKAQPLTDVDGNAIDQGGRAGTFRIGIVKGHPYSAAPATLAVST